MTGQPRGARLPTSAILLIAVGVTLNLSMVFATVTNGVHPDFRGLHAAAKEFSSGRPLYSTVVEGTRNLNPPHIAVAMSPLAWLDAGQAIVVWWILCAACAWASVVLWGRVLPSPYPLIVLGAILVTPAGYGALRFGAWTWPLTALISWAWVSARRGHWGRAGMLLGLLAACRVFGLLFVPFLVWKREWKALGWFSAAFAVVWLVGVLVCGSEAYFEWIAVLGRIDVYSDYFNSSFRGFSERLMADWLARPRWVVPLWLCLSSAAVTVVAWLRLRRGDDVDVEWAAVVLLSLLLSPVGWSYYMALAAGPVGAIAYRRRSPAVFFAVGLFTVPWAVVRRVVTPDNVVILLSLHLWGALALLAFCILGGHRRITRESDPRAATVVL